MTSPLAWSHRTTEIPEAGLHVRRAATAAECAAIAEDLDIVSCEALEADYGIGALGEGRYRLKGRLTAQVTRECVVTLEPVGEKVAEDVDVAFWPFNSLPGTGDEEMEVSSIPEVEAIEHGQIDGGGFCSRSFRRLLTPIPASRVRGSNGREKPERSHPPRADRLPASRSSRMSPDTLSQAAVAGPCRENPVVSQVQTSMFRAKAAGVAAGIADYLSEIETRRPATCLSRGR